MLFGGGGSELGTKPSAAKIIFRGEKADYFICLKLMIVSFGSLDFLGD